MPGARIHMLWKSLSPVRSDAGFSTNPTTNLETCPDLDVICACGGLGVLPLLGEAEFLDFLRSKDKAGNFVTCVCSGSLLLGAAGLLEGYEAGCHWAFRDRLSDFGAKPVAERVIRDRNRITGGGVTAGVDFGPTLAAELAGEELARTIQLFIEYDPQPPFDCGSPKKSGPDLKSAVEHGLPTL